MRNESPKHRVRLLLVDDQRAFAEATAEFLKRWGLDVRLAEDAKGALEAAEGFRPQIVVCDMMLPDLSGLGLVQALRSNPHTKDAIFALYSALAEVDIRALEREAGDQIDLFFSKPLTETNIKTMLDKLGVRPKQRAHQTAKPARRQRA